MEDSQFFSIRVPNSSHCTSQLPNLATQPPTSVQQVHSAPQAPAPVPQPAAEAPDTPSYVDEIHMQTHTICLCIKSLNILKKTDIIQNLFFHQNGTDTENQLLKDVSKNSQTFGIHALT